MGVAREAWPGHELDLVSGENGRSFRDEGKHFRQGRQAIERELARAPEDIRRRIQWLPIGVEVEIAA